MSLVKENSALDSAIEQLKQAKRNQENKVRFSFCEMSNEEAIALLDHLTELNDIIAKFEEQIEDWRNSCYERDEK